MLGVVICYAAGALIIVLNFLADIAYGICSDPRVRAVVSATGQTLQAAAEIKGRSLWMDARRCACCATAPRSPA